jgi:hypothetical protein
MKQILLLVMICIAINGYSQNEFSSKFKAIPPLNTTVAPKNTTPPVTDTPAIVAPNIFKKPDVLQSSSRFQIGESKPISMEQTNDFINPGDKIKDKLNMDVNKTLIRHGLKEDDSYIRKKDVDFGVIRTNSDVIVIKVRDYGAIDGDLIKATLIHDYNKEILVNNLSLETIFIDVKANLKQGVNFLELEALNRGTLGGNTGDFEIYDGQGTLLVSDFWNNIDKGIKSKFTFIKE